MDESKQNGLEINENDIELLVDTLRQLFGAEKARYTMNETMLIIEISGLATLSENEISEIAEPVFEELDPGFEEIMLLNWEI